jgi:glycosyltransferase involved in cell wall biosynthesis
VHKAIDNFREMTKWLEEIVENSIHASVVVIADSCDGRTMALLEHLRNRFSFELVLCDFKSPGSARKLGLSFVKTDWVVFWDSDDVGYPSKVQSVISEATNLTQAIIGTYETFDREGRAITKISPKIARLEEIGLDPGFWRMVFRVERIAHSQFVATQMGEDQLFLASIDLNEDEVLYSESVLYKYFSGSSDQLTNKKSAISTIVTTIREFKYFMIERSFDLNPYVFVLFARLVITSLKNKTTRPLEMARLLMSLPPLGIARVAKGFFTATKLMAKSRKSQKSCETTIIMTGGLGNQLFQLAAAMSGTKGLINLEVSVLRPRKTDGILDLDTFLLPTRVRIINSSKKFPKIVSKSAGFLLRMGIHPSRIEKMKSVNESLKKLGAIVITSYLGKKRALFVSQGAGYTNLPHLHGTTLLGYFQSYRYINNPEIERDFMSLKPKEISVELQKLIDDAIFKQPTFVHIRLTDYTNEAKFGLPDENYYRQALESLNEARHNPIWIFSDDIELARSKFPAERVNQATFIGTEEFKPAEVLQLMRYGRNYIIANSSFSWWAAALRFNRDAKVIAPKPWFLGQDEPRDLIFPDWGRMEIQSA